MSKKSATGFWEKLIICALLLYGLHWLVSGWWATLVFKECRADDYASVAKCDCKKTAFRNSLNFELFMYSAITENEKLGNSVGKRIYNNSYHCR